MKAVRDVTHSSLIDIEHTAEELQTKTSNAIADLSKEAIDNIRELHKTTLENLSDTSNDIEKAISNGILKLENVGGSKNGNISEKKVYIRCKYELSVDIEIVRKSKIISPLHVR